MYVQYNESNLMIVGACALFCLLACLYNVWNSVHRRHAGDQRRRLAGRLVKLLEEYARRTPPPQSPDEQVYRQLMGMLRHAGQLIALDQALEMAGWSESVRPPKAVGELLLPVYDQLCRRYRRADDSVQGFVLQLVDRVGVNSPAITEFTLAALNTRSLYLRIQALHSLGRHGETQLMVQALTTLSGLEHHFSSKLVTDALMDFTGDHEELGQALIARLGELDVDMQCAVIAYAQNRRDERLAPSLCRALSEPGLDKEVRIALLKFFGEVYYAPAYPEILRALRDDEWEYVAVAAKSAPAYATEELAALLKQRLGHQNWYVRYNSAMALVGMLGRDEAAFRDVLGGGDRYARDIIRYALGSAARG